ncbi:surface antigen (D15) [Desulfurobacterium thermolithotrophum DSM 11699]|uniref:Surface antigen (D15) n=1 Tax=Desulfurobacterium thermolithotrophum (strain DSM 11699 / BSA) TaxID=868864 RepID=F0S3A2_DESTD|nr:BamA/TamA family outer membrane protein [Desulfurobacterium thermolithotrophum]ADY73324.1 surface antigen (D15) [Desulfurobacterium thermolithotrophum DSM 11699]
MRLLIFLLFIFLPLKALGLEIIVGKNVYLDRELLKQIKEQSKEVCKFTDCKEVTSALLEFLGYRTFVHGDKIFVEKCEIIRKVVFKGAPKEISESLKTVELLLLQKKLSNDLLDSAKQLLLLKLRSFGYRSSKISFLKKSTPTGYVLIVNIYTGPLFVVDKVEIVAPEQFKPFVEKTFGKFLQKSVNINKIKSAIEKIENFFIEKNYYNVSVRYSLILLEKKDYSIQGKKRIKLFIKVKPGKKYVINFKSNKHFSTETLKKLLTFKKAKSLDEFEIENSIKNIENFYKNNGYPFAKVKVETQENTGKVILTFIIYEGKYTIIKTVRVIPNSFRDFSLRELIGKPFSLERIKNFITQIKLDLKKKGYKDANVSYAVKENTLILKVNLGKKYLITSYSIHGDLISCSKKLNLSVPLPYTKEVIEQLKDKLLECYAGKGYPDVSINVKEKIKEEKKKKFVHLSISILPGKKYKFGYVLVQGLKRTRLSFIKNIFVLEPGEVYSRKKVIKQYSLFSESRLFSTVNFEDFKTDGCINEVITLKEGALLRSRGFVGYGTHSGYVLNGLLSSTSPLGYGIKYSLFGNYRQKEGYDAVFRLRKPFFPSKDYETSYSIVKKEQIFESFIANRTIYNFSITRRRARHLEQTWGLEIGREKILETSIQTEKRFVKRAVYYDQIYDKRNNTFNPTKGYLTQLTLLLSGLILGGNTDYYKVNTKFLYLLPLFKSSVIALRTGVGIIEPIRGSTVPLQDRFYLGGAESIRGYKYGTISPKDEKGNFIGGNAYLLLSIENRFNFKKNLQFALFYDSGNVFPQINNVDLNFLKWYSSVGIGLRYITPVGPLRIDYGFKLKKVSGEGRGRIHISFGFPF